MKNALLILFLLGLFSLSFGLGCGNDDDDDDDDSGDDDNDTGDDDDSDDDNTGDDDDDTAPWEPIEPHKEMHERYTVVWLSGTPYEMGYQQGQLLHDELAAAIEWLDSMYLTTLLPPIARLLGLTDLAYDNSYPDIIDECQGLVDAAGDTGWTMDICMLLNFGDVLIDFLAYGFPAANISGPGCTQASATGDATVDGRLYHARSLDWSDISFMFDYPTVFVRQPDDGIPHMWVGFPGNLSPYNGMNAAGVTIASDEADPLDSTYFGETGRSHVQMVGQILKNAESLDDARTIIETTDHMCVTLFMISDGEARDASVFEMTAKIIGERRMGTDEVLWVTNHFVAPETEDADEIPVSDSSSRRFDRVEQLIDPEGEDTQYGDIDPEFFVSMLRDRVDPWTHEESPVGTFDNNKSIATNGAIYQIVFSPEDLCFWVASGEMPVPEEPFIGFSLGELLGLNNAVAPVPETFE
jgi:Acyl-coenzyme A:6-aminopenicillanic acid acyl-transferase